NEERLVDRSPCSPTVASGRHERIKISKPRNALLLKNGERFGGQRVTGTAARRQCNGPGARTEKCSAMPTDGAWVCIALKLRIVRWSQAVARTSARHRYIVPDPRACVDRIR